MKRKFAGIHRLHECQELLVKTYGLFCASHGYIKQIDLLLKIDVLGTIWLASFIHQIMEIVIEYKLIELQTF